MPIDYNYITNFRRRTLVFGNMTNTTGVAVDFDVYVIDGNRVLQLPKVSN